MNVDFEWFDPQPDHDFHGMKILLRQLFDNDAQNFDLSALTDLILSQPLLGSTVKTEGNESDPYAFLTVLNLQEHKVCCLYLAVSMLPLILNRDIGQTRHPITYKIRLAKSITSSPRTSPISALAITNSRYRVDSYRASNQHPR